MNTVDRVRKLFPLAVPLVVLTAACSAQPSPVQPSSTVNATTTGVGVAPQAEGSPLLAAVRRATARFHDVDKAIAAGYLSPAGMPCDQTAAGAMGIHAANPALIAKPGVDPEQPEVLLYLPKPGGGFRLVGVEYLQPAMYYDPATGTTQPWFPKTDPPPAWELAGPAPTLFGETFQGPMPGHTPAMPWHYDLHVWAWAPNPSGMFAQFNPSIGCN